jgi:hypothetical protein
MRKLCAAKDRPAECCANAPQPPGDRRAGEEPDHRRPHAGAEDRARLSHRSSSQRPSSVCRSSYSRWPKTSGSRGGWNCKKCEASRPGHRGRSAPRELVAGELERDASVVHGLRAARVEAARAGRPTRSRWRSSSAPTSSRRSTPRGRAEAARAGRGPPGRPASTSSPPVGTLESAR